MNKLSAVFMGTPDFAANLLGQLFHETSLDIRYVLTQPDQKAGRKQIMTPTPVKKLAENLKIPVFDGLIEEIDFKNLDLAIVYSYGKIIPANFLHQPKYGFWNLHPSLLPKFRGPSPIAFPLVIGEKKTGITLIQLDEKVDHGPIIAQRQIEIQPMETRMHLEMELTDLGAALFRKTIGDLMSSPGSFRPLPQPHTEATYTRLLKKEDGLIPYQVLKWGQEADAPPPSFFPEIMKEYFEKNKTVLPSLDAEMIFNLYRGLFPWPGVWTILPDGRRLKITSMTMDGKRLKFKKVQLEGKNEVDFDTFRRAYKLF